MKSQMKAADRSGAALAVIVGEDEVAAGTVTVRDLRGDAGQTAGPTDLVEHVQHRSRPDLTTIRPSTS